MQLTLGGREIQLIELNIHSDDATVIWLPDKRILLAGDTLEDTVTYVGEPENFDRHLEIWSGCGRSTRPSSCRTMATPTSSPPAAIPKC